MVKSSKIDQAFAKYDLNVDEQQVKAAVKDIIANKWTDLYDRGVFTEIIESIRSDSQKYKSAFTKNYKRWSNMRDKSPIDYELNQEAFACKNEAESAEQLAHWLEKRIAFMNEVWHK